MHHAIQPINSPAKQHFVWNPTEGSSITLLDKKDAQQSPVAVGTTPLNPTNIRHFEKKNRKRKRKKNNIWWPWTNYKEWLANNERKSDDQAHIQTLPQGKIQKKFNISKRKRKTKKGKSTKNISNYERNNTKDKKNDGIMIKEMNNVKSILPYTHSEHLDSVKFRPNNERITQTNPLNHSLDDQGANQLNSSNNPTLNVARDNDEFINYENNLKTDSEIVGSHASSNNVIEHISDRFDSSIKLEEDNDIKKIYHSLPYWKNSIVEIASNNNFSSDINECLINNGECEGLCINTKGSYRCHCPTGLRLDWTRKRCLDVNECLSRNGHGPCDGACTNTWGSFYCNCEGIPGTSLASDGKTCQPLDDCAVANCSHACIPTRAGPFCTCPLGLQLSDDWKTCTDINECLDADTHGCLESSHCFNTFGSFKCVTDSFDV